MSVSLVLVKILVLGICRLDCLNKQIDAPAGALEVCDTLFVSFVAGLGGKTTVRTTNRVNNVGIGQNTGFRYM